jgi:hypothetical protein
MEHDPHCLLNPCICGILTAARSEERAKFQDIWKVNLPLIEHRNYKRGYHDGLAGRNPAP